MAAFFAAAACLFAGCDDDDDTETAKPAAPGIVLDGSNIDQPQEMAPGMSVKIDVTAPGKIRDFTIAIDSPFLTEQTLESMGLAKTINLANPASAETGAALAALGLPVGAGVTGKESLSIDISRFVPLIMEAYDQTADHKFTLTVTDKSSQRVSKTLTLHQTESSKAAPVIVLVNGDIDAPQEIVDQMTVQVSVTAPGAIAGFTVGIDSPALTPEILGAVGLGQTLDLVNPGSMADALGTLGFPTGDKVEGQTVLTLDISKLVPMIAQIYTETSDHKFTLKVTDKKGQSTTKTLTFHLEADPAVSYNDDANLWANTATVTATGVPQNGSVQYRVKGSGVWIDAVLVEGSTYSLTPVWTSAKNDAELDIHSIAAGSGIFAATTYEVRVAKDDRTLASTEFSTAKGDAIPNGDMSGWSKKQMTTDGKEFWPITYPNAEGDNFWDSGNNMFLEQEAAGLSSPLCFADGGTACLMPQMVLGAVFAPGNMYTGYFDYSGFSGTAKFGQPYAWTARPRALRLRMKAKVDKIDKTGSYDPNAEDYKGKQDRSCIFAAVVNWSVQHGVTSGMVAPSGMWNPADAAKFDEGPVLGYGQEIITESTDDWVTLTIPFVWYDKTAANPSSAPFSLVISCATSMRGDYLTGSTKNEMRVDDFEWVY